jgi:hypothetical protein
MPHAPKNLFRLHGDVIESNALRLDRAVLERLGAIIITAGDGQK